MIRTLFLTACALFLLPQLSHAQVLILTPSGTVSSIQHIPGEADNGTINTSYTVSFTADTFTFSIAAPTGQEFSIADPGPGGLPLIFGVSLSGFDATDAISNNSPTLTFTGASGTMPTAVADTSNGGMTGLIISGQATVNAPFTFTELTYTESFVDPAFSAVDASVGS